MWIEKIMFISGNLLRIFSGTLLFDPLSAGGKVTMELQDMFWGAYFGSCTDKYGVHWMVNCNAK